MNILISSAGSQNACNVISDLRKSGRDIKIIACDCGNLSAGLYMADKGYVVPRNSDPEFIPEILKIIEKEKIDMVMPTYSTEFFVFAKNADKFKGKIVISSPEVYLLSDNKPKWKELVSSLGINVPQSNPTGYPMIVKPITGSGSKNQFIVHNQEELLRVKNHTNFCEEYIDGQEYVVDGMSDLNGKFICGVPRIRLETRAGGARKAISRNMPDLVGLTKKIVEAIGLVGAWNVQCIEKDFKYYFIDINNRFPSGGTPLASASGVDQPVMMIDLLLGNKIEPKLKYNLIMLRYDYEVIISEQTATETNNNKP